MTTAAPTQQATRSAPEQAALEETIDTPAPDDDTPVPPGPGGKWTWWRARQKATLANLEPERAKLAQSIAGMDTALKAAEERCRANRHGETIAAVENLRRDLKSPRERLRKLDEQIDRARQSLEAAEFLIAHPPREPDPNDPNDPNQHPVVMELRDELDKAEEELEQAGEADEIAAKALEAAEIALGRNPSPPQNAPRPTYVAGFGHVMRADEPAPSPHRANWLDALERKLVTRERLKDATAKAKRLRARLTDQPTLDRLCREHDESERRSAIAQRERDELAAQTRAAGAEIVKLIRRHRELQLDDFAMRREITAGIEGTGFSKWDVSSWVKPW